ncbi:hypothetical protein MFLAVUS_002822 [Mucor flavus]|uniref:Uncharacterized protein n=1 Tax=Mucor flavus TaxID=439312 RepID=A0ABP9YRC4_9FUNG
MSYTPPDPFQHNHHRQTSLATVYEENDPYRIIKKSPRIGSMSDNSSEFDAAHSRTASDSSTSRLYTGTTNDYYDDPYANKKKNRIIEDRANSYLPYSHHERDPHQKSEPIYIEEYTAPASTTLGMGSMLHDTMTDQINGSLPTAKQQLPQDHFTDKFANLSNERRKKEKRIFGLRYPSVIFIAFLVAAVIAVIWYFVWPRIPNLALDDIDNVGTIQVITNTTTKSMSTEWSLNMTVDNTANWVPTRIKNIDLSIVDDRTNRMFGNGTTGWITLPPRKKSIVPMYLNVYYESNDANDTTFQDLYNACGVQVNSNMPFESLQGVLNVTLSVTFHIAGIVWPTTKLMRMTSLICPTS